MDLPDNQLCSGREPGTGAPPAPSVIQLCEKEQSQTKQKEFFEPEKVFHVDNPGDKVPLTLIGEQTVDSLRCERRVVLMFLIFCG